MRVLLTDRFCDRAKDHQALPSDRAEGRRSGRDDPRRTRSKHRLWNIPGARTKNGHSHSVPLSSLAIELIGKEEGECVFPNSEGAGSLPGAAVARTVTRAQSDLALRNGPPMTFAELR